MNTPLIARNSDRVMAKTTCSQAQAIEKVQRLESNLVASSEAKWGAPRTGEDIVSTNKKLLAAMKVINHGGNSVTNCCEDDGFDNFLYGKASMYQHQKSSGHCATTLNSHCK